MKPTGKRVGKRIGKPPGKKPGAVHLCRFDTTLDIKNPTYEKIKERVLEVGRFSIFEATANAKMIAIFSDLHRDPELVCTPDQYPWTKVERRI